MRWRMKNVVFRTQFHQVSGIHHSNAVGNLRDNREIVRNKKHGQAKFGPQFGEELEDLRLHRNIESSGWFVGNQ
jgi:hypothetical protein